MQIQAGEISIFFSYEHDTRWHWQILNHQHKNFFLVLSTHHLVTSVSSWFAVRFRVENILHVRLKRSPAAKVLCNSLTIDINSDYWNLKPFYFFWFFASKNFATNQCSGILIDKIHEIYKEIYICKWFMTKEVEIE